VEFIEAATSNQAKLLVFTALSDVFGNLTRTTYWRVATHDWESDKVAKADGAAEFPTEELNPSKP
jgi:hypothetical protein